LLPFKYNSAVVETVSPSVTLFPSTLYAIEAESLVKLRIGLFSGEYVITSQSSTLGSVAVTAAVGVHSLL
jgi:hypothetical protein